MLFTEEEIEWLARPHIARAWFAELDLPTAEDTTRLHSGTGRVTVDGFEWVGISDPVGGRLVSVGQVEEPVFGQAASVAITLSGATAAFVASVKEVARDIEGRTASVYWAAFDGETQAVWPHGLKAVFRNGRMSAPALQWQGIGIRTVTLTIESMWSSQNFAPGGRWNDADQQRRYAGDLGMQYVGQKIEEKWV